MLAVLVICAEITTIFSFIVVLIVGLVALVYNLLPLCIETDNRSLMVGGLFACLIAIGQIVTAAIISQDTLQFCGEYDMEDSAMCDVTIYRVMNSVGAVLWIHAGIIVCTLSDSNWGMTRSSSIHPSLHADEVPKETRSIRVAPDGKSITTQIVTTNPDGSKNVTETVEEFEDCEI
jgi:hypothetical protein